MGALVLTRSWAPLLCSSTQTAGNKSQAKLLLIRLLARDYSKSLLRRAYSKAVRQTRNELLFKTKISDVKSTVKYITRFSSQHSELINIMTNHWHLLQEDTILKKYIGQHPKMVFRWARSLCDRLLSCHYPMAYTGVANVPFALGLIQVLTLYFLMENTLPQTFLQTVKYRVLYILCYANVEHSI